MKDFWKEPEEKKVNKKKIIISIIIIIIVLLISAVLIIYINNENARNWIDKNILQKEITQNNLPSIELEDMDNANIYAFNRYIGILSKNNFDIYNSTGKEEATLTLEISKPIFSSNGRYLAVAEEKGQKLYLIENKEIVWETNVEGNISQITINKNGYVAVTIVDTSYKTVIAVYDNAQGEQPIFKTFLSYTRVSSTSISDDNKYLAFAEIDTSGTLIQSNIKIISVEAAKNDPENSTINTYSGENNELVTKIKYQEKNKLLCMFTNKIIEIKEDGSTDTIQEFGDKKISFVTVDLANASLTIEEQSSGLFTADSIVNIVNSDNKSISLYTAEAVTKEIYTNENIIALNLGSQVEFINTSGWLVKRYTAEQEITSVVLGDSIAGIVYRDKIEIVNL